MPRIAINGFGRIGRQTLKAAWGRKGFNLVAINDLTDAATLAYLLKYDTNYGIWHEQVTAGAGYLQIGKKKIPVYAEKDPSKLPWKKLKVDVVIESTGFFRDKKGAELHRQAGAHRVVISAPGKGMDIPTFVFGANGEEAKKSAAGVINNASCTTNSTAPVLAILDEAFGVEKAMLTTVHGYTSSQALVDSPQPQDLRRGRAAAVNMIPTTTGAAKATTETLPQLTDVFEGIAIRVPVPTVSLSDMTVLLNTEAVTIDQVNNVFHQAVKKARWKGVVAVTELPLVSTEFVGDPHSATVDLGLTRVTGGNLVKVVAWYDNEWGYANRLAEMAMLIG